MKGYWNHLFLPEGMRTFQFQDELVEIKESNLPDLDHLQRKGMPLPFFEFRRWCRLAEPDFFVVYTSSDAMTRRFEKHNGKAPAPILMQRSWMLEWFLGFNPVGSNHDYFPSLIERDGSARNSVPTFAVPKE